MRTEQPSLVRLEDDEDVFKRIVYTIRLRTVIPWMRRHDVRARLPRATRR
jgi:hypothetical protein